MLVLLLGLADAYESDTLTNRDDALPDVTEALDARVDEVVAAAIAHTNEKLGCGADVDRTRDLLARAIHVELSANEFVGDRGGLRAFGFDRYSAWIEKGAVPRRDFTERVDLFASTTVREAPLLKWAGVCSTVKVNGVLVGTDKLDHFFEEGYNAWRRSGRGEDFERAVEWATRTENTKYGLDSSETFSWGDLRADYDGMMFYDSLLEPGSVAVLDARGCVVPGEAFTWSDWITWEYDEVLNPPVYTPSTQRGVDRHLALNRDQYCAEYAVWGGEDYQDHLVEVLGSSPEYASDEAPVRYDPYALDELCESAAVEIPDGTESRRGRRGQMRP